jgi:hypothetical protein
LAGVLYLNAPVEVLEERVQRRAEASWLRASLAQQVNLYEEWFRKLDVPKQRIDTAAKRPMEVVAELKKSFVEPSRPNSRH